MAIPNIVNVATIHAETLVAVLTTTLTTTLATGEAEHVYKINVLRCTNITDDDATVTIDIEKGGTHKKIANTDTIEQNNTKGRFVLVLMCAYSRTKMTNWQ